MFKDELINNLHELYRNDPYINSIFNAVGITLDNLADNIQDVLNQYDFTKMTWGIPIMEKILDFKTNSNTPIEDRRAQLQARWKSNGKSDIYLLQNIANSWKNGDCQISFVDGKINVKFIGEYGVPNDLDGLKKALDKAKPAHLAILYSFRYLTINEVENMTITQLEQVPMNNFAF